MKRIPIIYLASAILCSLALAGCEEEISDPSDILSGKDIKTITCTVPPIAPEEDFVSGISVSAELETKGYLSGTTYLWSVGDRIGIVPTEGSQLYFEVEQGDVPTTTFDGGSWSLKTGHTFWAYYPLCPDIFMTKEKVSVSFDSQVQTGNNNNSHVGSYMCLYTDGTSTSTDALSFQFHHLTSFFKTYVTVPAGKYSKVEFKAPSAVFIKRGWFNVASDSPAIIGSEFTDIISVELEGIEFTEPAELTAYAVVAPVDISNIPITVTVFGEDVAYTYTLTKTSPMVIAKTYAFRTDSITEAITNENAANSAFASGETDVNFAAIDDADGIMDLILPNTTSDVSISLPLSEADIEMNISYPDAAVSYPTTVKYSGPATSNVMLDTPHSTVILNGISYGNVVARTAPNTIIVEEGVTVEELDVLQGSVTVYGTVDTIDLSDDEDEIAVVHIYGQVDEILGEDDDDIIIWHNGNVQFGDPLFKAYCVQNFDTDGDGEISITEAEAVDAMSFDTNGMKNLEGLGFFSNLDYLSCWLDFSNCASDDNGIMHYYDANGDEVFGLESLDVSQNTKLTSLECGGNQLTTLDLSKNSALQGITCRLNQLTSLDFSNNTELSFLSCEVNQLTSLDISKNTTLSYLCCNNNRLTSLDVSNNTLLQQLYCGSNQLTSLDISKNTALSFLGCEFNQLTSLDVSKNTALDWFECAVNHLTSLDVDANTRLRYLNCGDNQLTRLDVSSNRLLENLNCVMSTLDTLFIAYGQTIPYVTENRSEDYINQATEIVVKPMPQPEAVDLGLSVKWASFNLGASKPEEYGGYFQWAGLDDVTDTSINLNSDNCPYHTGSDGSTGWTKYVRSDKSSYWSGPGSPDNKTVLDPEDDVAHIKLGDKWRMPTTAEFQELKNNCTSEWTTLNGVNGRKFTSKKNGNSIFLPAAGVRYRGSLGDAGFSGDYWSSSNPGGQGCAYGMYFNSDGVYTSNYDRSHGQSVRPVSE